MSTKQSVICSGSKPAANPMGQETITQPVSVAVAPGDIELNDLVEMWILPAGCIPVGYELDVTDLDTGTPAIAFDFGVIDELGAVSIDAVDGGDEWIDNSTLAQAGGIVLHTASAAASRVLAAVQPVDYDRKIGVKIMTAAGTAAAGTFSGRLSYRAG